MSAARLLILAALLILPGPAVAHPVFSGANGFYGGVLHPLLVPAHLMAIVAAALLGTPFAPRPAPIAHWPAVVAFALGLAAGFIAIADAYAATQAGDLLLALAAISGAAVALANPFFRFLPIMLASLTGLAVALDSPPDVISIREAIVIQLSTFCGALILFGLVIEAASRLDREWQHIGARILGSWITASAILVLALRLSE
jgi:urease accessory protein